MILAEMLSKDDSAAQVGNAKHFFLGWLLMALDVMDEFTVSDKTSPEGILKAFIDINTPVREDEKANVDFRPDLITLDDVRRGYALFMLTKTEEDGLSIPDEWVLYDEVAFLMKELWF